MLIQAFSYRMGQGPSYIGQRSSFAQRCEERKGF